MEKQTNVERKLERRVETRGLLGLAFSANLGNPLAIALALVGAIAIWMAPAVMKRVKRS